MWKRICAVICTIIITISAVSVLTGCSMTGKTGSDCARLFLKYVSDRDFSSAYALIRNKYVKESNSDPATNYSASSTLIDESSFIKLYSDVFNAIGVTRVNYVFDAVQEGSAMSRFSYTLTYECEKCDDITSQFTISSYYTDDKWQIAWEPGLIIEGMDWGDSIKTTRLIAQRGEILADRVALAGNISAMTVSYDPSALDSDEVEVSVATILDVSTKIAEILGMKQSIVFKRISNGKGKLAWINDYYPTKLSEEQLAQLLDIKGIDLSESSVTKVRNYPESTMLSHVVGYMQKVSEDEITALNEGRTEQDGLYNPDSTVGVSGLERLYEKELRGKDGYAAYIMTEDGRKRSTLISVAAQDGNDVELTVDYETQKRTEELLESLLYDEEMAGAVVVMNPKTGAIQAMASYPTFDLNAFIKGMSEEEFEKINAAKYPALINRVTRAKYPPGSTFKVVTAAAALTYGTLSTEDIFDGEIVDDYWIPTEYGPWMWAAIKRTHMIERTEPLNMRNALLNSDNIYFANAALKMGDEKLKAFWNKLGMDETIDFDLAISSSQYENKNTEEGRYLKLVADSGYGQGHILVTPLQLACTFCALANGGDVPVPYIVDSLKQTNGFSYDTVWEAQPRNWREDVISDTICDTITQMLKDVVDPQYNGTGRRLRAKGCIVAGKTGTAEVDSGKSREIAWFCGYRTGVSAEDERLVLVMLELPTNKEYSDFKFIIARELLSIYETEGAGQ